MLTVKFSVGSGKATYAHTTERVALQTRFYKKMPVNHIDQIQHKQNQKNKTNSGCVCVFVDVEMCAHININTSKFCLASFIHEKLLPIDIGDVILVGIA